ncbi:MAG: heat shock protein 90 [Rickettsiaceae bacterium]|jgi:molecular chaperone HtpG|nr:heat shock protein 90 [Rickettsiaceae bacterium]
MQAKEYNFDVEVGKVLNLMINSLYTNKDVALRELISNASDACDKFRYLAVQNSQLSKEDEELKISISVDKKNRQLIIQDNGIGMNEEDLRQNLGTIAKSGTENFIKSLTGDNKKDLQLIGQFGVGFYSAFMIADKIEVISKKYDDEKTYSWQSKGGNGFSITESNENIGRGTKIILHLKEGENDFLDRFHIKHVVQTYSDHINIKIEFIPETGNPETLNSASALWTKPKEEITAEQYQNFFKHISHLPGDPFMVLHNKAEGVLEYTNLLFIPSTKPFDLFHPDRKGRVKLYVKKIFISEDLDLVPAWLRFLRGLIDSQDLPLNISRETLQYNLVLEKIKKAIVKKVLSELKKKASDNEEEYVKFWNNFGAVLKEGLCESHEFKDKILEICRFYSSKSPDKLISIAEYLDRCKIGQDKIYYLTGESIEKIKNSPQLEAFVSKDIEVLFLTDTVDDFWVTVTNQYKEKDFQSITRSDIDLENIDKEKTEEDEEEKKKEDNTKDVTNSEFDKLIAKIKTVLGEKVKDVKISKKLDLSPVCLAVDATSMDIRMERYLLEQKQILSTSAKILEINPNNKIIKSLNEKLASAPDEEKIADAIKTLFDQACIIEGEPIEDIKDFSRRLNELMSK